MAPKSGDLGGLALALALGGLGRFHRGHRGDLALALGRGRGEAGIVIEQVHPDLILVAPTLLKLGTEHAFPVIVHVRRGADEIHVSDDVDESSGLNRFVEIGDGGGNVVAHRDAESGAESANILGLGCGEAGEDDGPSCFVDAHRDFFLSWAGGFGWFCSRPTG